MEARVRELMAAYSGRPHIFNLGHGVHQHSDPDVLHEVVRLVHDRTARA